jgi:hypothetical protein
MLKFDRIVLVVLAMGVWALVLAPREIGARSHLTPGQLAKHSCYLSGGTAHGYTIGSVVVVDEWHLVGVGCDHE